ncbi:uncharacterized protein isoform X3 [Rhodnius prolixus]
MAEQLLPLEYKVKSYLASFQKICFSSKKIVFVNIRREFILPTIYEIGIGSLTPQRWLFKIILHDSLKYRTDARYVIGEIMLSGLPFIEEIIEEKNLEKALRHADFLVVHPIQAFPLDELENNIRNEFKYLKALSLAVKKCARESIKIIVISCYTGIYEYLIMKISETPGEQISGMSRYSEARAIHYIAKKVRVKLDAISHVILLGDNIIDCCNATVSRDLKPGKEISLWEVLQLPKPLLGYVGYDELKEVKSIIPAEATAQDRVFKADEYSLKTIVKESEFLKYIKDPEQKEITRKILYQKIREKLNATRVESSESSNESYVEGELSEEEPPRITDSDSGKSLTSEDLDGADAVFGEDDRTGYLMHEGSESFISEEEEHASEDAYKKRNDDEYKKDNSLDYTSIEGEELGSISKRYMGEEEEKREKEFKEEAEVKRSLTIESLEQLMAKLTESKMEEIDHSEKYPDLKIAVMNAVEDEAWCKYTLLKLVKHDEPPYGYALASSFIQHCRRIIQGSKKTSSMTVLSDGSYEIPEGMFAAFPVKISGLSKKIEIVK